MGWGVGGLCRWSIDRTDRTCASEIHRTYRYTGNLASSIHKGYLRNISFRQARLNDRYATPKYACAKASTVLLRFFLLLYKTFKTGSVAIRRVFNECLGTRAIIFIFFFFFFFDFCPNFHLKEERGRSRQTLFDIRSIYRIERVSSKLRRKRIWLKRSCFAIR